MLSKVLWNSLLVTPAILGAALIGSSAIAADAPVSDSAEALLAETAPVSSVEAATVAPVIDAPVEVASTPVEQAAPAVVQAPAPQVSTESATPSVASLDMVNQYSNEGRTSTAQVTSVSQLSDVQPTDWAFQALQSLVERYGVIAGYPDGTYRGNRALTRYEFAAGLNAALDRVNELIAAGLADAVTREDLATLQRLQEEFAAELATLRGRVDALEARTAELEANQFSTTTVLRGRTIFSVADVFGDAAGDDNNTVFQSRVRLNFDTSFTGRDRLRARLQWGNFEGFDTAAGDQIGFSYATNTEGEFRLGRLEYYFPLGDRTTVYLEARGGGISDIVTSVSPLDDPEQGSISYFGYNPIYDLAPGQGIGAGLTYQFTDALQLGAGYLAGEGNDPGVGAGLFNGDYSAFAQLTFTGGPLTAAFTYVNTYLGGSVADDDEFVSNAYGLSVNYALSPRLQIGGWFTYLDGILIGEGDTRAFTYAAYLALPDLGKPGNLAALIVGVPTRVADVEIAGTRVPGAIQDAALHIEGFYRYALTDNISITPGIIWLIDPGNNNDSEDVVVGAIRTSFSF